MNDKTFRNLVNTHVNSIYLRELVLTDQQFDEIIRCIGFGSLQILKLRNLEIRGTRVEKLAESLKHNSSLQTIDLSNNEIEDMGVQKLAQVLIHNSSLQTIDLSNNEIGDMGVEKLAEAIMHNSSLQSLDLFGNEIGDMGAQKLAEVLQHNQSLRTLNLAYTKIGNLGAKKLAGALQHNYSLQTLNLRYNFSMLYTCSDIIIETLKVNPFITIECDITEIEKLCSEEGTRDRMAQYMRFKHTKSSKN